MSYSSDMTAPYWIDPDDDTCPFPDVELALREPDGLLAIGGSLSPKRLINAYRHGIFPWYSEGQPILWWSPDPRSVLFPENLKISRSLKKTLKKNLFEITIDKAFPNVIGACAEQSRPGQQGTWITPEMSQAYVRMHELGFAHSAESWQDGKLVGGLYGIQIGKVFFGESMFSYVSDASKVAFVQFSQHLEKQGIKLIDCQVQTAHLNSLGAENITRKKFIHLLDLYCEDTLDINWNLDTDNHA